MGAFLIRTGWFSAIGLVLCLLLVIGNQLLLRRDAAACTFPADTSTLLMGDSHPRAALDPTLIRHSASACQDSEIYFFSFYKLRFLIDHMQLRRVVLGCSYHNFSELADQNLHDPVMAREMFRRYSVLLDREGLARIRNDTIGDQVLQLRRMHGLAFDLNPSRILRTLTGEVRPQTLTFFGGHKLPAQRELSETDRTAILKRHYMGDDARPVEISSLQVEYLKRIAELCDESAVQLWLIVTPLHPDYIAGVPDLFARTHRELAAELSADNPSLRILDWSSMAPVTSFADHDHVNADGARRVSTRLDQLIADELPAR